jgi:hypothetical protein
MRPLRLAFQGTALLVLVVASALFQRPQPACDCPPQAEPTGFRLGVVIGTALAAFVVIGALALGIGLSIDPTGTKFPVVLGAAVLVCASAVQAVADASTWTDQFRDRLKLAGWAIVFGGAVVTLIGALVVEETPPAAVPTEPAPAP